MLGAWHVVVVSASPGIFARKMAKVKNLMVVGSKISHRGGYIWGKKKLFSL
jgi:hypothetical protein